MLNQLVDKLNNHLSKERAYAHVMEVAQHHRIQASPGFRDAAKYCLEVLANAGVEAKIESYAGDGKTQYWGNIMPGEWMCQQATLTVQEPENKTLCSYPEVPLSLIQRSASTPVDGVEAELVILDQGDTKDNYENLDLTGKIVMTDGDINKVRSWAVEEKGAIGIITDKVTEITPVRHRFDIPDALQYTSFWWYGDEKRCFGFVVSPKTGDWLRALAKKQQQADKCVKLQAQVQAEFYDGHIEVVNAVIPGQSEEEVVVIAHLCHPAPSANDNASGTGVALEVAETLQKMIKQGVLAKPQKTIRFLLLPEMSGSYAFLANNEDLIPKMVAALNLDMVGEDQSLCESSLLVERPPQASFSFAGDLMEAVLQEVTQEVPNVAGTAKYALFKHAVTPFSGGSDHYIFSDPTVGVGCPMLIQWPDKFYHTSLDTIDKVDPKMLKRVAVMTAAYSYFIASATPKETWWLGQQMLRSYGKTLSDYLLNQQQDMLNHIEGQKLTCAAQLAIDTPEKIEYLAWVKDKQLGSLARLANLEESVVLQLREQLASYTNESKRQWLENLATMLQLTDTRLPEPETPENKWQEQATNIVPQRIYRGPLSMRGRIEKLPESQQQEYQTLVKEHSKVAQRLPAYLLYWADGERTLADIGKFINYETGNMDWEFAVKFINFIANMKLIELK